MFLSNYIREGVSQALELVRQKVNDKTPEDTGELIAGNIIRPISNQGGFIIGTLQNDVPYAPYVEYGVMNKNYNYYKNGGRRRGGTPFYIGIGASMYRRTKFEEEQAINTIIRNKINQGIIDFNKKNK